MAIDSCSGIIRYTNDTERIADGYGKDNRQYYPGRRQVLSRPKAGTIYTCVSKIIILAIYLIQGDPQTKSKITERSIKCLRGIRFGNIRVVKQPNIESLVKDIVYTWAHGNILCSR